MSFKGTVSTTLDSYFKIAERGSSVGQEVRGGVVTFLTMAYIIVLNPIILAGVPDKTGRFLGGGTASGSGFAIIAATTALVAGPVTILMGVRGKTKVIHPLMWIVAALFVVYFAIDPIGRWLN